MLINGSAPLVSVICITYNHVKYLRDALDGFVCQKASFPFEILVHDDCSTDGTTDILREYAQKYPDLIVPLYEEQNCYSRGIKFMQKMMTETARGKYIALCEGDDYWTDPYKLQKQVDYLEAHADCSLVIHNGYAVDVQSGARNLLDPYQESNIISTHDVICEGKSLPPTASMMFPKKYMMTMPEFFLKSGVGDRSRRMYLALKGHVYYMHEPMCEYRMNAEGSFSQRVKNEDVRKRCLDKMIIFFDKYDQYTEGKYAKEIEFVKSREYWLYYGRSGKMWKAYWTRYYQQTYTLTEKLRTFAGLFLPEKVKRFLKDKILKRW